MEKTVIFGGGQTGRLFYNKFKERMDIIGFSDNNEKMWNQNIMCGDDAVLCIPPASIPKDALVVIAAAFAYQTEIAAQMDDFGLKWKIADAAVFDEHKDDILKIENECLTDDRSREIYRELIRCRTENDNSGFIHLFEDNQYYAVPEFRMPAKRDKLYIDAGAFVGDSIEKYIYTQLGIIGKVIGIEPGPKQYAALQYRMERLIKEWALEDGQVISYQGAVGEDKGYCSFWVYENIATSRVNANAEKTDNVVPIYKLDDLIHEEVSFIKADIEGAELSMLRGGEENNTTVQTPYGRLSLSYSV